MTVAKDTMTGCRLGRGVSEVMHAFLRGLWSFSRWTQRSVKSSNTIHILSVLSLLFLPHCVDFVPRYFGILRRFKHSESHHFSQQRIFVVLVERHGITVDCLFTIIWSGRGGATWTFFLRLNLVPSPWPIMVGTTWR